jgi:sugar O-acyltransferase (sialic acid O-acetyltransferase NeuD family)
VRLIIIGAGGHAQVVADIVRSQQRQGAALELVGYLDDECPLSPGLLVLDAPVLGKVSALGYTAHDVLVIAIGNNAARARLTASFGALETFATLAHPSAVVAADVVIGGGSMLCAGAIVNTGSRIGRGVILNTACSVDHHTVVGDFVHIAPGVHMGGGVTVGEGALVGIGAVILPRIRIGAGSTIGAGAVVTRDVPAGLTVMGVPARVVRSEEPIGRLNA